jgi:hypothetical protein
MGWQERLRVLGEQVTAGEITTAEYRERSDEILTEADREAAAETQPTGDKAADKAGDKEVHIPVSAAWEAPSGEMTQIVGTDDKTTLVSEKVTDSITQKLVEPDA